MIFESRSVEDTRKFGAQLAGMSRAGDVYALEGDLGAGKTELVRGFVSELGGDVTVHSPSFTILNVYQTQKMPVYHFDFYRMYESDELFEIGFYEYVAGDGICLIEWGTMFRDVLPSHTKIIRISDTGQFLRKIEVD